MKKKIKRLTAFIFLILIGVLMVASERLPIVGSDSGTWGSILNNFLGISHTPDGSINATTNAIFQKNVDINSNLTIIDNVGIGITNPTKKLHVVGKTNLSGDVWINGILHGSSPLKIVGGIELTDNKPITGYTGFPLPNYDSGWIAMNQNQEKIFIHNLGSNVDNYIVDVIAKTTTGSGINQVAFRTKIVGGGTYQGYYWRNLDTSIIKVYRNAHDTTAEQIRVRIWKIG